MFGGLARALNDHFTVIAYDQRDFRCHAQSRRALFAG